MGRKGKIMKKIMRIGTIDTGRGRRASVYIKSEYSDGKFSMSGVIGPLSSGNALGGCGQICMEFAHRNPADDDKRYGKLISPSEIVFATGWDAKTWLDLLDVWKQWHLNDMQAACEHQQERGWTYEDHHDKKTFKGDACPVCGYEIGSAWLKKRVPQSVIDFVSSLPNTDKEPSWI